jgi:hypothetical protein
MPPFGGVVGVQPKLQSQQVRYQEAQDARTKREKFMVLVRSIGPLLCTPGEPRPRGTNPLQNIYYATAEGSQPPPVFTNLNKAYKPELGL